LEIDVFTGRRFNMETIDVRELPEPLARAVEAMVQAFRDQLGRQMKQAAKVQLPTRPGGVIGEITRESIYGDYLDRKIGRRAD